MSNISSSSIRKVRRQFASDMQAPDSLPISGKRVGFPEGKGAQFFRVLHVLQKSQHSPELVHGIRRQTFRAVLQVEPFQTLVDEVSNFHWFYCSLLPYACQPDPGGVGRESAHADRRYL